MQKKPSRIYRDRWYVLDETIIGIILQNMPDYAKASLRDSGNILVGSYIRNSLNPGIIPSWNYFGFRLPVKAIKRYLREMDFGIEQAAVWYSEKGNKKDKIKPGFTGLVTGAFFEDVQAKELRLVKKPKESDLEMILTKMFRYLREGYTIPEEESDRILELC